MHRQPTDLIDLTLPADPRYLRLTRTVAADAAAVFGASEDAAVELCLAVDEAGAVLIEGASPCDRLRVECAVHERCLVVTLRCSAPARQPLVPHPVAAAILAWSVERYDIECDADGHGLIRLVKSLGTET